MAASLVEKCMVRYGLTGTVVATVLGEKLGARLLLALALGAAAVALLAWRSLGVYAQAPLGVALGLIAGIGWAVGTLILKRGNVGVHPLVLSGWQLLVTAVPTAVGALWLAPPGPWALPSVGTMALILYIALVPMAIGNAAWFAVVGLLPASVAGLSAILVPVVAMVVIGTSAGIRPSSAARRRRRSS